eukprot:m.14159 g.14159  ORF g.14159 m.14159 type:complete len:256 (+) comp6152_c0_seq2:491-1258(+)
MIHLLCCLRKLFNIHTLPCALHHSPHTPLRPFLVCLKDLIIAWSQQEAVPVECRIGLLQIALGPLKLEDKAVIDVLHHLAEAYIAAHNTAKAVACFIARARKASALSIEIDYSVCTDIQKALMEEADVDVLATQLCVACLSLVTILPLHFPTELFHTVLADKQLNEQYTKDAEAPDNALVFCDYVLQTLSKDAQPLLLTLSETYADLITANNLTPVLEEAASHFYNTKLDGSSTTQQPNFLASIMSMLSGGSDAS